MFVCFWRKANITKPQVFLITGTRNGIGRYLAHYYVEKGFQVVGCSRRSVDFELRNYRHFCLDVSDEIKVKQMFSQVRKTYNRLDVLINNAGVASMSYVLLTPIKTVQEVMNTNVIGTFLFCREAGKLMKRNRYGRIVNISSIHVPLSTVGSSIYSASKAAIEQFSRVLAKEIASDGVTVNTLGLSIVTDTGMAENLGEDAVSKALQHTVLKSALNFKDVSHAMDFLISERSKTLTSQTLYLGGI